MPKFTRNLRRIEELKKLRDVIEDELERRTRQLSEFDSFRVPEILIWLRLRDGSFVHGRLMQVQLDHREEWRSQKLTARGSIYLLRLRSGSPFWVDLLEVQEAAFDEPKDYVPSGNPLG